MSKQAKFEMTGKAAVGISRLRSLKEERERKEIGCSSVPVGSLTSVSSYCVDCVGEEGSIKFPDSSQSQELLGNYLLSIPLWEVPFGLEVKLRYPGNNNGTALQIPARHTTAR
jgi:hypothetical protein